MDIKSLVCPVCGGELEKTSNGYKCKYCDEEFKNEEQDITNTILSAFDEMKKNELSIAKKNLYDVTREKYLSYGKISDCIKRVKELSPDDFMSLFFENIISENANDINDFIVNIDVEKNKVYIPSILEYMISNYDITKSNIIPLRDLIERFFVTSIDKNKYNRKIEEKARIIENGIYNVNVPRDCFIAYSSKDTKEVTSICDYLELNGLTCFVSIRNLPTSIGSVENYQKNIETAIKNSKVFVFLSSENSRNIECDCIKKEIPYLSQHPEVKRIEYEIEKYGKDTSNVSKSIINNAFENLQRCIDKEDLLERITNIIYKKYKICCNCLKEVEDSSLFCTYCGKNEFVLTKEEAYRKKDELFSKERAEFEKMKNEDFTSNGIGLTRQDSLKKNELTINERLFNRAIGYLEYEDNAKVIEICDELFEIDPHNTTAYVIKLMMALNIKERREFEEINIDFSDNINFKLIMKYGSEEIKSTFSNYLQENLIRIENEKKEKVLNKLISRLSLCNDISSLISLKEKFLSLGDYKNCKEYAENIESKIQKKIYDNNKIKYDSLVEKYNSLNNIKLLDQLKEDFLSLGDFEDSQEYPAKIDKKMQEIQYAEKEAKYIDLINVFNSTNDVQSLLELKSGFMHLEDFEDSMSYVTKVENKIEELHRIYANRDYDIYLEEINNIQRSVDIPKYQNKISRLSKYIDKNKMEKYISLLNGKEIEIQKNEMYLYVENDLNKEISINQMLEYKRQLNKYINEKKAKDLINSLSVKMINYLANDKVLNIKLPIDSVCETINLLDSFRYQITYKDKFIKIDNNLTKIIKDIISHGINDGDFKKIKNIIPKFDDRCFLKEELVRFVNKRTNANLLVTYNYMLDSLKLDCIKAYKKILIDNNFEWPNHECHKFDPKTILYENLVRTYRLTYSLNRMKYIKTKINSMKMYGDQSVVDNILNSDEYEVLYTRLLKRFKNENNESMIMKIKDGFLQLNGYKESQNYVKKCSEKIETIRSRKKAYKRNRYFHKKSR